MKCNCSDGIFYDALNTHDREFVCRAIALHNVMLNDKTFIDLTYLLRGPLYGSVMINIEGNIFKSHFERNFMKKSVYIFVL